MILVVKIDLNNQNINVGDQVHFEMDKIIRESFAL